MPTHNYRTNPETLLLLAWCSTLDLPALIQKDKQARPHKYYRKREEWLPTFPEEVLLAQVTEALSCFQDGPYDPVFQSLVKYRLLFVDLGEVAGAIGLKDLTEPWHGLFYSDNPFIGGCIDIQRAKGPANETDAFLQAVSNHAASHERLVKLSQIWSGHVCLGAQGLRIFFQEYARLLFQHRQAPFFVAEFLGRSLQQIDWHTIAASLLDTSVGPCQCTSEPLSEHEGTTPIPLFRELLTLVGEEIRQGSRRLPNHLRSNALFLSGLCYDTTRICTNEPL